MQYILTEEEYKNLISTKEEAIEKRTKKYKKELQEVCTLAAINTLLPDNWISNYGEIRSWGCILEPQDSGMNIEYCDDCPSQKVCPNPHKGWSQ